MSVRHVIEYILTQCMYGGILASRMTMDLRLGKVLLVGAGTVPTVAVKCDPGAAVLSTVAALEGCCYRWSLLAVLTPHSLLF